MPWHPGHRQPALPGPGPLLPRAQAAPMSIPMARPGPPDAARGGAQARSGRTPSGRSRDADSASPCPRRRESARQARLSCMAERAGQARDLPVAALPMPVTAGATGSSSPPSAGLGRRSLLRKVNVAIVPGALQGTHNDKSALEDCQVQVSRTAPITAIPVRSIPLTNGGLLVRAASSYAAWARSRHNQARRLPLRAPVGWALWR
jgi:hypothetical protein